jgi:hypothetical protein
MWVSTHILAGLAIAALLGGPWWLVAIAVVLAHVVMDLIPHWDYTHSRHYHVYGWADVLSGLAFALICWSWLGMPFWMVLMGLLSGAPDFDIIVSAMRGPLARRWFPSHWRQFPHGRAARPFGIGVQVLSMLASGVIVIMAQPY